MVVKVDSESARYLGLFTKQFFSSTYACLQPISYWHI